MTCIDKLTFGEIKELMSMFGGQQQVKVAGNHPMLGRRCLVLSGMACRGMGTVSVI